MRFKRLAVGPAENAHLHAEQAPPMSAQVPPPEQASPTSKDAMIYALQQQIKKLEEEKRGLKRLVEVAHGLLYEQDSKSKQ